MVFETSVSPPLVGLTMYRWLTSLLSCPRVTISVPSGDHDEAPSRTPDVFVSWFWFDPLESIRYRSLPSNENTSLPPSGDHDGSLASNGVLESCAGVDPVELIVQISCGLPRTNAIFVPSGENVGSIESIPADLVRFVCPDPSLALITQTSCSGFALLKSTRVNAIFDPSGENDGEPSTVVDGSDGVRSVTFWPFASITSI